MKNQNFAQHKVQKAGAILNLYRQFYSAKLLILINQLKNSHNFLLIAV